jgi:mono/diheme cytochrome c family protein
MPLRTGFGLGCWVGLGAVGSLLAGCQDVIDLDPVDERAPIEARVRPGPISGGTLIVTSDGVAVAADPDRDLVHVVEVEGRSPRHTIALEPGDEPGRVVQGSGSLAHVVLRGFGGLATLDLDAGTVLARHSLCPDPRGAAFDSVASVLHVACADGTLVTLDEASGEPLERRFLAPDLRDVVILDGAVYASQFRTADVLGVAGEQFTLHDVPEFATNVAWRTWSDAPGRLRILHQLPSKQPVPTQPKPESTELPYGGGETCSIGITGAAITTFVDGEPTLVPLRGASLAVDAAISPDAEWAAVAMPGAEEGKPTAGVLSFEDSFCLVELPLEGGEQVTSVAFAPDGALVMQSREPARLLFQYDMPNGRIFEVELEGETRYDTGHEIFHRKTESGLSCASCHPEGTDDGHVWLFEGLGLRRTQPLDVGLEGTAPFHWDGDMGDLDILMEEVLAHRMGGKRQTSARGESFTRWLFAQERPPADAGRDDPTLVAEGEALFEAFDCSRCHTGPALGGSMTTPIRGAELQVPSLRRVSLHPPFMHDGRAATLEAAVRDMIEATLSTEPTPQDVEALTAYMRTL